MQLPIKSPFKTSLSKPKTGLLDVTGLIAKMGELDTAIRGVHDLKQELKDSHAKALDQMKQEHAVEVARVKKLQLVNKGDPGTPAPQIDDQLINRMVTMVQSNIRLPKDGETPIIDEEAIAKRASRYIPVIDKQKIAEQVYKLIPQPDHNKNADRVLEILQSGKKKISVEHIGDFTEGLEQTLRPIRSLMAGFRGGGDVVTGGTGIAITTDSNGKKVITNTGSSITLRAETPTGLIDGVNKVYTVSNTINSVIGLWINGEYIHPAEYTAVGTTITFVTALDASLSGLSFTIVYT